MKNQLTISFEDKRFQITTSKPYTDKKGKQKRKCVFLAVGDLSQELDVDNLAEFIAERLREL